MGTAEVETSNIPSIQLSEKPVTQTTTESGSGHESVNASETALSRTWLIGLAILVLATFPLWVQSGDYPRVSWLPLDCSGQFGFVTELMLLTALAVAISVLIRRNDRQWIWWVIAATLCLLVLMDQHRLQPWVYQLITISVIVGCLGVVRAIRWTIPVTISIYLFSALGKFDYQFTHTVGAEMIQSVVGRVHELNHAGATRMAFGLPVCELSVAVLLAVPKTRRLGGWLAIMMHVTLIGILGPWNLDHSWGVLVWNAMLATQAFWLFVIGQARAAATIDPAKPRLTLASCVATLTVTVVLLMPLLERFGCWDHWTSWALYSPHNSRVRIEIHRSAMPALPSELQQHLDHDRDGDGWRELDFETWSLQKRLVPVYPQARYQLSVAHRIAIRNQLQSEIRATFQGISDRWTGERHESYLIGKQEIETALDRYWICQVSTLRSAE